jgi:predicted nuclease of predicted toxin-antitoxin system
MQFKTDENIPLEAVDLLRAAGHDARSVFDQALSGRPDKQIASVCKQEDRALITLDTDFSDIRTYHPADYAGLLVLRLAKQSVSEVVRVIHRLLEVLKTTDCHGQLWIVERNRIRIRS